MAVILFDVGERFESVIVMDWSARSRPAPPRPCRDALWWCRDGEAPRYERTRQALEAGLIRTIEGVRGRVLLGFDFSFSYPRWFLDALGVDWRGLWSLLTAEIVDLPERNNRFEVAAELNRRATGGPAPFWGTPRASALLPPRKPLLPAGCPELRACELALRPRPKSGFQLWGAGSVGSQTLLGIPLLERLRRRFGEDSCVWPFEAPERRIVLAEVYPSCLPKALWSGHPIPDREQVLHLAAAFREGVDFARQRAGDEGGILLPSVWRE
jgi:molybdopterin molybdotransferase